jgi:two-component system, OmpR family, phosphate regulon sensor histidine kinase PhoR
VKLKKKIILLITILLTISLLGLILLQIYFIKNAIKQEGQAFDRNVLLALNNVAHSLEEREAANGIFETALNDFNFDKNKKQGKTGNLKPGIDFGKEKIHRLKITMDSLGRQCIIDTVFTQSSISNTDKKNKVAYSFQSRDSNRTIFYGKSDSVFSTMVFKGFTIDNKEKIVSRVVDKLILTELKPIQKRIKLNEVDSLLKLKLNEVGINLPYTFGIITDSKDSAIFAYPNTNKKEIIQSGFKVNLFAIDIPGLSNSLAIYFSGRNTYIIKGIATILILAILFITAICLSFIYTLRTIFYQKKFAVQIIDFINNMTHEFKTPISTISLAAEAIDNPSVAEDKNKLGKYNQLIKEENMRMRNQVEKILQMAVIEEGDFELSLTEVDIHKIIEKAVHNFAIQIDGNGEINKELNAVQHLVKADHVHITNIVNNIIENAIKYSTEKISISVSTKDVEDGILIIIEDRGIGIKEEDLKNIFNKYYRVPTGNVHDIKGFGLGLSYVKMMVEAHKGSVRINSKYGKGTQVQLIFPVNK